MGEMVYGLGALVTLACTLLLARGFLQSRLRLLLWSALCFAGLTVSNTLLFVDLVVVPDLNLYAARLGTAAVSMALLLYGLVWDSE
jgi:hypothetical protein